MCNRTQTGWFIRLSPRRLPDGKQDYARDPNGRRMVYNDDECKVAMLDQISAGNLYARTDPAYGPTPTSLANAPITNADATAIDATPCLLGQGVDSNIIPANPGDVTDEMYDRFSADQRVHYHRMSIASPKDWKPYPA